MNSCLILIVKESVTLQLRQGDTLTKVCVYFSTMQTQLARFSPRLLYLHVMTASKLFWETSNYISKWQYYFEESIEALHYYSENRYQFVCRWQIDLFTSEWVTNLHILTPNHRALKVEERLACASINLKNKHLFLWGISRGFFKEREIWEMVARPSVATHSGL